MECREQRGRVYAVVRRWFLGRWLACHERLAPLALHAHHCPQKIEITCGQILLEPFVCLAQGKLVVGMAYFDVIAGAGSSHLRLRSRLLVAINDWHDLDSPRRCGIRARGDVNSTSPITTPDCTISSPYYDSPFWAIFAPVACVTDDCAPHGLHRAVHPTGMPHRYGVLYFHSFSAAERRYAIMDNSSAAQRILVCVAWPYAKSSTHVGQIVGAVLPGDIFARYHRLAGNDVLMVSGSDMHGTPITVDADKEGVTPQALASRYHQQILEIWQRLGISFDLYTTTTTANHYRQTQTFFLRLLEKGYIFKDTMESPYCPVDQRFLPDRYVEGTCPYCGFESARGDQCDNCGRTLDPTQLIAPRCRLCGSRDVEIRPTEHFFLDLPQFERPLRHWLQTNKEHWRPNVLNFALNWIKEGLRPRAITRDLDWGVPIPLPGFEDKRMYVWFDAVIGYFSASIEWVERCGDASAWQRWWVRRPDGSDPARSYYFIGKDNIAFHTIIWPALLMGVGGLAAPYDVPAH